MPNCGCVVIYGEINTAVEPVCFNDDINWSNPHNFKVANRFRQIAVGTILSVTVKSDDYKSSPVGGSSDRLVVMMSDSKWLDGYDSNQSNLELFADLGETIYMPQTSGKIENFRNFFGVWKLTVNPANKLPQVK
jgi:hypothetical protein